MAVDNIDNIVYCQLYYFWRVILAPIGILPTQNRQYSGEDNIAYIALYSKIQYSRWRKLKYRRKIYL